MAVAGPFRALHDDTFVMPNPHDPGTARLLEHLGFRALATTSAGYAFTQGRPDGGISFDAMLEHCRAIVDATSLPVSADLERGMDDSPESAAETVRAAAAVGLAGCSLEDFPGGAATSVYDFPLAVERIAAAAEAARSLDRDFVLTARAENLLRGIDDLDDTIRRLQAFADAGADVLYAPGIGSIDVVRAVCEAVPLPVNVLAEAGFTVADLRAAGARRISVGSKVTAAAFGAVRRAAQEMLDPGTFGFAADVMPFGELQELFAQAE